LVNFQIKDNPSYAKIKEGVSVQRMEYEHSDSGFRHAANIGPMSCKNWTDQSGTSKWVH